MTPDADPDTPLPGTTGLAPSTAPGLAPLQATGVDFELRDRPSEARSLQEYASFLGVGPERVTKTLVVRLAEDEYVFVIVPGDRSIAWKKLRAALGRNRLTMPGPDEAKAASGYERGTITPFGASHAWPVIVDATIAQSPDAQLVIGLGSRDVAAVLTGQALVEATDARVLDVTEPLANG